MTRLLYIPLVAAMLLALLFSGSAFCELHRNCILYNASPHANAPGWAAIEGPAYPDEELRDPLLGLDVKTAVLKRQALQVREDGGLRGGPFIPVDFHGHKIGEETYYATHFTTKQGVRLSTGCRDSETDQFPSPSQLNLPQDLAPYARIIKGENGMVAVAIAERFANTDAETMLQAGDLLLIPRYANPQRGENYYGVGWLHEDQAFENVYDADWSGASAKSLCRNHLLESCPAAFVSLVLLWLANLLLIYFHRHLLRKAGKPMPALPAWAAALISSAIGLLSLPMCIWLIHIASGRSGMQLERLWGGWGGLLGALAAGAFLFLLLYFLNRFKAAKIEKPRRGGQLKRAVWIMAGCVTAILALGCGAAWWLFGWRMPAKLEFHEDWTPQERAALNQLQADIRQYGVYAAACMDDTAFFDILVETSVALPWLKNDFLLHAIALRNMMTPRMRLLKEAAKNKPKADSDSGSLFQLASEFGQTKLAQALVSRGCDPNAHWPAHGSIPCCHTPLSDAIYPRNPGILIAGSSPEGRRAAAEWLMQHGADIQQAGTGFLMACISAAIVEKNDSILRWATEKGADWRLKAPGIPPFPVWFCHADVTQQFMADMLAAGEFTSDDIRDNHSALITLLTSTAPQSPALLRAALEHGVDFQKRSLLSQPLSDDMAWLSAFIQPTDTSPEAYIEQALQEHNDPEAQRILTEKLHIIRNWERNKIHPSEPVNPS